MSERVVTPAPQQYPMNREQRREHFKEARNDPFAIFCPRCKHKTRHVSLPVNTEYLRDHPRDIVASMDAKGTTKCNVVCVACGNVLRTDVNLIPYEYVKQVPAV